jgi:hypothetical protein
MPQKQNPNESRPAPKPAERDYSESGFALLVNRSTNEMLTEHEYEKLTAVLRILRAPKPLGFMTLHQEVLDRITGSDEERAPEDAGWICDGIAEHFSNIGSDQVVGFISSGDPELTLLHEKHRLNTLLGVAAVLESNSWLGSCIGTLVSLEKDRPRTPAEVAQYLIEDMDQFSIDVSITQRTLRLYPQLFEQPAQEAKS